MGRDSMGKDALTAPARDCVGSPSRDQLPPPPLPRIDCNSYGEARCETNKFMATMVEKW
ncbi:hypothetical protein BH10PSE13_BH10PSE13_10470 [soil metagenome]